MPILGGRLQGIGQGRNDGSRFLKYCLALILFSVHPAWSSTFSYPNPIVSVSGLSLVGTATHVGNERLRLVSSGQTTSAGGVWRTDKVDITAGFSTTFGFNLNDAVGAFDGGFAFVVQAVGPAALGSHSRFLGYSGDPPSGHPTIAQSLAVEFDTKQQIEANDPSGNHIGIQSCGMAGNWPDHNTPCNLGVNSNPGVALADGLNHIVTISYVPGGLNNFKIFVDGDQKLASTIDLKNLLNLTTGKAWVGFTAGTAGGSMNHDIFQWQWDSAEVPEPSTWMLLLSGLGAAAFARRKRLS
jgi:hypothetical protein